MEEKIVLTKLKCKRCGHEWVARVEKVRMCPKCKSAYWDVDFIRKKKTDNDKKI
jgi:predicted Zn-ribbon and HTH transcriptional regulator